MPVVQGYSNSGPQRKQSPKNLRPGRHQTREFAKPHYKSLLHTCHFYCHHHHQHCSSTMKNLECIWMLLTTASAFPRMRHFSYSERITRVLGEPDAVAVILEAVVGTLRETWIPDGTVVFISDDSILPSDAIYLSQEFGTGASICFFEIPASILSNDPSRRSSWLQDLELMRRTTFGLTLVIRSDDEDFLSDLLRDAFEYGLFVWPCRVFVATLIPRDSLRNLKDVLSNVNGMIIVYKDKRRYDVFLYQPYSHQELEVAQWDKKNGLQYKGNVLLLPDKFHRFSDGAHLRVADDEFTPYVSVQLLPGNNEKGEQKFTFRGPMMKFLKLLSADMNFTYTLKRSPDGTWGYVQPNGTATGLIGLLARKEADISLGPFAITQNRAQVMDYTHAIIDDQLATIGSTGSTEIDVWAFVMPLTFKVWLSIFASLFLLVGIMRLLVWTTGINMKDKTFVFVSILLVQGARDLKRNTWQRMIVGAWIVGTTVLVFSYSGNLMSLLAVRYLPQPYQTLRDVLDDPDVTMVWEVNTAYVHAFRKATSGELLRVKETDDRNEIVYVFPTEYHYTLNTAVITGRYVLTLEAISIKMLMAEQFTSTGKCQFYISKGKFMPNVYAVGVQKKSSLLKPLNKRITAITQSGIYHYWLNKELQNATTCLTAPPKIIVHSALSMKNIWGIFMILVVGHGVSIVILFLEIMAQNSMKKSSRRVTPFEDI